MDTKNKMAKKKSMKKPIVLDFGKYEILYDQVPIPETGFEIGIKSAFGFYQYRNPSSKFNGKRVMLLAIEI